MTHKLYNLQVTAEQLELLSSTLDAWEKEPVREQMMVCITSSVIKGARSTEEDIKHDLEKAQFESRKRKMDGTRLRMKILEAQERPSEFEVVEEKK